MLERMPEIVRTDVMPDADDIDRTEQLVFAHPVNRTSSNGVTGSPSRASAEKGREWFDWDGRGFK